MEEESSDNDVKQRATPYYVSNTQAHGAGGAKTGDNALRKPIPRYWHTNVSTNPRPNVFNHHFNPYKKVNTPNNSSTFKINNSTAKNNTPLNAGKKCTTGSKINKADCKNVAEDKSVAKEEKTSPELEPLPPHLSIFQSLNPQQMKKTIEVLENEDINHVVQLESSDEDEVIEVALPPKPTITIESSDDEEVTIQLTSPEPKGQVQDNLLNHVDRAISSSPVPSVVSSVSDDFIRGDCIALNISSRHPDSHSFDFSQHGTDLIVTPSKKKKKKKNKENVNTSTIVSDSPQKSSTNETCFATPKSKAKNKKQKKLYAVTEKCLPSLDVYDSDSNQSIIDITKNTNAYMVTEKSLPSIDVYESDSNASEPVKELDNVGEPDNVLKPAETSNVSSNSKISPEIPLETVTTATNLPKSNENHVDTTVIDLTLSEDHSNSSHHEGAKPDIQENIVMGNVTGFPEPEEFGASQIDSAKPTEVSKYASTKVPAILYDNLDFDNLKGKETVCTSRRYSPTTLRAEMEKFYNESWGGEDFNHRELQKNMSRDKSLWAIDPKDRMPSLSRKKMSCNHCNRVGHRDDMCRFKRPVCFMCGNTGHFEPRCPTKICVNCGAPNYMYSTQCRNCATWCRINCAECGQNGHPSSHCPDVWRRYHNTTDMSSSLEENHKKKHHQKLFCSGCTQRGHLVHTCRYYIPFSGLPINSPYVRFYRPIYSPLQYNRPNNACPTNQNNNPNTQRNKSPHHKSIAPDSTVSPSLKHDRNKRQSNSPTVHESHSNKKRLMSTSCDEEGKLTKSPGPINEPQRKLSQSKDLELAQIAQEPTSVSKDTDKAPTTQPNVEPEQALDFIPIFSSNRDKKGQIIQDNEVSDTSDVVTSARIYVTNDISDTLKTEEGRQWLQETTEKNRVVLENSEITLFLNIKGKVVDQEAFQTALREKFKKPHQEDRATEDLQHSDTSFPHISPYDSINTISKNRFNAIRKIRKGLDSLKTALGEPKTIYKELSFLQSRHEQLLKAKEVSRKQLFSNRQRLKKVCRSLNTVLIGQAGLADGPKHLAELNALHEKLVNYRQKHIPDDLRREITYHYDPIFSTNPRDDYNQLLQTYYQSKQTFVKKNKNYFKVNPMKKMFNPYSLPSKNLPPVPKVSNPVVTGVANGNNVGTKQPPKEKAIKAHFNKLVFYHKRLSQARPYDAVLKKTKTELVRKLHAYIGSLGNNDKAASAKTLKKVKKVERQAQVFLNNQRVPNQ